MHKKLYVCRICSYKIAYSCLSDRLKLAMLVTGELLLIFSLGDYHKVAVSCVSYSWPMHIYDCRVSCKDIALDLNVLSDILFRVANACNCTKLLAK